MAQSFGSDPERYDRARPSYPAALVERVIAASPGRDVLDVGCGTGIVARQFQAAGCSVLGVEPDARMAGHARVRLDPEHAAPGRLELPRDDAGPAADVEHVAPGARGDDPLDQGGRVARAGAIVTFRIRTE